MIEQGRTSLLEWAAASRPMAGQMETGDLHLVVDEGDSTLVAVIDGLGHGPDAAVAARAAKEAVVKQTRVEVSLAVSRTHEVLRGTRGVALSVARFDGRTDRVSWVGYGMPRLAPRTLTLGRGDTVILATDGLRGWSAAGGMAHRTPHDAAAELLERFAKPSDDSLVLVARYWGLVA